MHPKKSRAKLSYQDSSDNTHIQIQTSKNISKFESVHLSSRELKDYSRNLYPTYQSLRLTIVSQLNKVIKLQTIIRNLNSVPTVYHSRY